MTKDETLAAAAAGEGCLGRSQADEPVFVLVARDVFSSMAIEFWARQYLNDKFRSAASSSRAEPTVAEQEKYDEAMRLARQCEEWRDAHGGGKVPD